MIEHGIYFASDEFKELILSVGGEFGDPKKRPIICVVQSAEYKGIYWAIPMGNLAHRTQAQIDRINAYMSLPRRDIRSCYYHIGQTDKDSIFFVSDALPITDKYIASEYLVSGNQFIVKNPATIAELERKLYRILQREKQHPNIFRQHITDITQRLLYEQK